MQQIFSAELTDLPIGNQKRDCVVDKNRQSVGDSGDNHHWTLDLERSTILP
jgi:hypothetical protein